MSNTKRFFVTLVVFVVLLVVVMSVNHVVDSVETLACLIVAFAIMYPIRSSIQRRRTVKTGKI